MGLLDKVRAWWIFKQNSGHYRSKRLYIVDAKGLLGSGKPTPRDQIHLMGRLSRFAAKEKIDLCAAFEGNPLRKVDHGEEFEGITVYYGQRGDELRSVIADLLKRGRRQREVMVITADAELEKAVASGSGVTMRTSTFKKALEGAGDTERDRRNPRGGQRRNRPRKKVAPKETPEQPQEQTGGVNDLIDLIE
ncbi:MAG: NYN domain-containing protein [Verrucomicrobia bacterium]|nr:NYN domain-containing protein [Verrucomicrobiota bacterium]